VLVITKLILTITMDGFFINTLLYYSGVFYSFKLYVKKLVYLDNPRREKLNRASWLLEHVKNGKEENFNSV